MKKVLFLLFAMALAGMTQAQFVIGAQGGYYWQKNSTSISDDYTSSSNFVGALQLGYWVTPKLYVGISGGYITASFDTMVSTEHSYYYAPFGMDIRIYDHQRSSSRSGWMVSPQVKYEVARFGNMHFNLLLQGTLRMLGEVDFEESYYSVTIPNPNEYREVDPSSMDLKYTSFGVSLRPTLEYEFSPHFSAELLLDLLSVGYLFEKETYDAGIPGIDPIDTKQQYFYAGLNSFGEALRWENTILKLGFNVKF